MSHKHILTCQKLIPRLSPFCEILHHYLGLKTFIKDYYRLSSRTDVQMMRYLSCEKWKSHHRGRAFHKKLLKNKHYFKWNVEHPNHVRSGVGVLNGPFFSNRFQKSSLMILRKRSRNTIFLKVRLCPWHV